MNRFALLTIDDDCVEEQPEINHKKESTKSESNSKADADVDESWNDGSFKQVKKKTKNKNKKPKKSSDNKSPGWQNLNREILIYILWDFLLENPVTAHRSVEKETFFALYSKCSLICSHWQEVLKSDQFWRVGCEKWGYGTHEQKRWIVRQPLDQQPKYWMKLFRAHLHDDYKKAWKDKMDIIAKGHARWLLADELFFPESDARDLRRRTRSYSP